MTRAVRQLAAARLILTGVRRRLRRHNLPLVAAGVAFYTMLAIFPAIIAMVSGYALVADPAQVGTQLAPAVRALPPDVATLITSQVTGAERASHGGVTLGLVVSLLATLWAASGGVNALLTGLDVVFGAAKPRPFLRQRALSLLLTVGTLVVGVVVVGLLAVVPVVLGHVGLAPLARTGAQVGRWVLLLGTVSVGLTVLYRYGPNQDRPRWRWVTGGVLTALLVWTAGSIGFTLYVDYLGTFNKTYGAVAAVVVLMLWLYVSALAVLLGAEVDAESEDPAMARTSATAPAGTSLADGK